MVLQTGVFVKAMCSFLACPQRKFHACAIRCKVFPFCVALWCPVISDEFCTISFSLLPLKNGNVQLRCCAFCFLLPMCGKLCGAHACCSGSEEEVRCKSRMICTLPIHISFFLCSFLPFSVFCFGGPSLLTTSLSSSSASARIHTICCIPGFLSALTCEQFNTSHASCLCAIWHTEGFLYSRLMSWWCGNRKMLSEQEGREKV